MIKKTLIALMVALSLSIQADTPRGKAHDFMIMSSPSSGSSFLLKSFTEAAPEITTIAEFFNRILRPFSISRIKKFPHNQETYVYAEYAMHPLPDDYFEERYTKLWQPSKHHLTKEVFMGFYIPFFQKKFTLVSLYRHRRYTFPTKPLKENLFQDFYKSFMTANYEKYPTLKAIKTFLEPKTFTRFQEVCLGHVLYNYVLLKYSAEYKVPVLTYANLLNLPPEALKTYLKKKIPAPFYTDELPKIIVKERSKEFCNHKGTVYQLMGGEAVCQELIAFIEKLDPDMPYWHLLE